MTEADDIQVVLILDLAKENPISEDTVRPLLPPANETHVFRLSDHGAPRAPRGSDARYWRPWSKCINRMLTRAREVAGADSERIHYYVAGRAGLPVFAYIGICLSKWARVTCLNPRGSGVWDTFPLHARAGTDQAQPFFEVVEYHPAEPRRDLPRKLAVFISLGPWLQMDEITTFMDEQQCELAGVVEIRATPANDRDSYKWLTTANAPQMAGELATLVSGIKNRFPKHAGVVVFIAGAAPLALAAGQAFNTHMYEPVWIPNFESGVYAPAIESPWGRGRKLKMLMATANPRDENYLRVIPEIKSIEDEIRRAGSHRRFELHTCHDIQLDELRRFMMAENPHILHFSGHSSQDLTYFVDDSGSSHPIPARGLRALLKATAHDGSLTLVVLNSCLSVNQARALTELVDCAIGMSKEISDEAAIEFAKAFYSALAHGRTVQKAYDLGLAILDIYGMSKCAELFSADGVDPDQLALIEPGRPTAG